MPLVTQWDLWLTSQRRKPQFEHIGVTHDSRRLEKTAIPLVQMTERDLSTESSAPDVNEQQGAEIIRSHP